MTIEERCAELQHALEEIREALNPDSDAIMTLRRMFETWGEESRRALARIDAALAVLLKEKA